MRWTWTIYDQTLSKEGKGRKNGLERQYTSGLERRKRWIEKRTKNLASRTVVAKSIERSWEVIIEIH